MLLLKELANNSYVSTRNAEQNSPIPVVRVEVNAPGVVQKEALSKLEKTDKSISKTKTTMDIILPGFTYKQYVDEITGETRERVYETVFQIDINSIEGITPSSGPESKPEDLPYSRVIGRSGRYYDIKLSYETLQKKIIQARTEQWHKQLIAMSN